MGFITQPDGGEERVPAGEPESPEPGRAAESAPREPATAPRPAGEPWDPGSRNAWIVVVAVGLVVMLVTAVVVHTQSGDDQQDKGAAAAAGTDGKGTKTSVAPCVKGDWPASFDGTPASMAGAADVAFIWRSSSGWTVRVRSGTTPVTVVLTSSGQLLPNHFKLAKAEAGTLEVKGKRATFTSSGTDPLEGFEFRGCLISELRMEVRRGTDLVEAADIATGANQEASSNPLVVARGGG